MSTSVPHHSGSPMGFSKTSLFFAALLIASGAYFLIWALGYTNHNHVFLLILATLFGLFMAFNIGGNDVANSFGTSVGAGTLTIKQALIVAAIFEVSGAVIAGGEVTKTIRKGIVDLSGMAVEPMQFVYIMMSALLAAATWLLVATKQGWPVSTTHSIIGGIVGSSVALGAMVGGSDMALSLVQWNKIGQIAFSWILSPVLGGALAYGLFWAIKKYVLNYNEQAEQELHKIREEKILHKKRQKEAFERLSEIQQLAYTHALARDAQIANDGDFVPKEYESDYYRKLNEIESRKQNVYATRALENWVPLIASLGSMIISAMLLFKGLKHMELGLTSLHNFLIMGMIGACVWMATFIFAKTLKGSQLSRSTFLMFSWMQVFTAAGFAFSHGANDIANAIGPFAAILDVLKTGEIGASAATPTVAMITFGIALVAGLWFIGKEVIQTVGHNLTQMHPSSGFSAELGAAAVVMMASLLGLPVSSTHILIGAVLGVGMVNHNTNWALMKPIALAWIITLPAAGVISALTFYILSSVF
ncbi:inorganic phosphate transporter [Marinobacterium marinum]|uniref:Phosphate transporter n=1 Tax=Marinobacterium marinum TaxID=2756129 RepID=A0A7W1WY04_9GAMM|nr:inorganic phosphate transporter [Marinobacterium marinum]MBA4502276.1 inorganic phosphate transporter [Marinobacterium marinum]